jgi:ABC-type phosphate transport system substrate-binding protein
MRKKRGWLYLVVCGSVLVCALPGWAGNASETIVVITGKTAKFDAVSRDDLRPIFQTKKDTWPDGSPVKPFNLAESSPLRHGFDAAVLGLDPERVARYWIDRKIRGGERPPQTAPSSAIMVKIVSKTPGAVGYVEANAADSSVKVVARIVNGQVTKP